MQDSLEQLQGLQNSPALSIIQLSETVAVNASNNGQKRSSDVSADAYDDVTPASLEADLTHYKVRGTKCHNACLDACYRWIHSSIDNLIRTSSRNSAFPTSNR